jgi:hypothetical protein
MEHTAGTTTLIRPDERVPTTIDDAPVDQGGRWPAPLTGDKGRDTYLRRLGTGLRKLVSEGGLAFLIPCALYVTVGALLDFRYLSFNGDAVARMANGFYVLYSRDPHLAAIGFVWNPGTSIADLVPLLFYHLWTPLASHMFAGSLMSASCMAGCVYQVRCTLTEWGVARATRLVLVTILALNGMIVYYGGNGMSEGLYLFTLVATGRYLLRWLQNNDLHSLVYAATALGACYLARNEAVAPALAAGAVVFGVAAARSSAAGIRRLWAGLDDLIIFEIPIALSFVGWAVVSYVIVGSPFEQLTSVYGTTSQLKLVGKTALNARISQDVHDVFYLAPAIPIIVIVALFLAWRRRDVGVLAPISVVGGGLAFDMLALIGNQIDHWFRYFITAVPLEVLLVGSFFATAPALLRIKTAPRAPRRSRAWGRGWAWTVAAVLLSLLFLIPSSFMTIKGMANPKIGYEETTDLDYIFLKHPSKSQASGKDTFPAVMRIVDYLARQHLANGQVIVDNFSGCIPNVIVASPNPDIFVIPNDRDFQRTLADPLTFHAHYILDANPAGDGGLTAPNILYPRLWSTGQGFSKLVHSFPAAGICVRFRLFKVTGHPALQG